MEEMIFNLADTHLFFNDLEVSSDFDSLCIFHFNPTVFVLEMLAFTVLEFLAYSSKPWKALLTLICLPICTY